ncbi:hypothetical protein CJD36_020290 [Flavipsychrobacter stenotrophus]|uniref:TonB-dependent receptor plug domain-containing protein n=1 Tax=Flavipsychrobacter stenotrophus TaxID=2077091 RepID=A0A2S7SRG3_9BACT|nr:TonB-dependent receptor [Flavipsychrobacter stenotrophus]PQJ09136.1 hypothetical protein CJD36_020290 [Flavipsychrobacter stenotrophus]
MIRSITLIALLFTTYFSFAQQKYTISGTVNDKTTGETIIGAILRIEGKSAGTTTNEYGFYSLSLPAGSYIVMVDYIGYQEHMFSLTLEKDSILAISMVPKNKQLLEVVVTSKAKNENITSAQMGMNTLNVKELNALPVLFGERDVMKIIQLLPGVKSAGDGNTGFFVRGGAADQNLILLDEAVVYNPSHLLGFFSVFNSDAIKNLSLYKGNEPAQYGGRLSSVMDIKMNDGNNQSYHASGGIGLISSRLNLEGPLVKDKGSFLVSARRTYADAFLIFSSDENMKKNKLNFYDFNAKLNYRFSDKDRIYLSGYYGKDVLGLSNLFGINWGNATGTLRWNHIFNPKLFSNTSLIYSNYDYKFKVTTAGIDASILSVINDWNFKEELKYFMHPGNSLSFGLNSVYHTLTPGQFEGTITAPSQPKVHSWENAFYIADSWRVSKKLNIDMGIRLSTFSFFGGDNKFYNLDGNHNITDTFTYASGQIVKTYVNPEPRLSASYQLNNSSSIKAAYGRNTQYLHLLSNSTTSNPTDKWVATNNIIKPELSDQVSLGYAQNFKDNTYECSVETYYKSMQHQVDYKNNAQVLSNDAIEPQLLFGQGRAYGIELLMKKNEGRFTGWVSYTLSRTELQIDGINKNAWYPAHQDQTHNLSVVGMYKLSKKWTVSADFVYYTGYAVTFPSGKYNVDNQVVFYYTERNAYRVPAYHRLDLGATCKLRERKHFSSEVSFSLYNAYGHANPYTITFQQDPNNATKTQAVQTSLFQWVPSISYNFKF